MDRAGHLAAVDALEADIDAQFTDNEFGRITQVTSSFAQLRAVIGYLHDDADRAAEATQGV